MQFNDKYFADYYGNEFYWAEMNAKVQGPISEPEEEEIMSTESLRHGVYCQECGEFVFDEQSCNILVEFSNSNGAFYTEENIGICKKCFEQWEHGFKNQLEPEGE